jgi:hypothetical protein
MTRSRKPQRPRSSMERMVERCLPWSFGDRYVPAFLATRVEGMSISRIGRIPMPNFKRDLHPQSGAEATVMCWVVYQPGFVEALENRPCCPVPGLPILYGHPLATPENLKPSSGTAALAEQMGIAHPRTSDDVWKARGEKGPRRDYYPLISDLLGIFRRPSGIWAANLFIKKTIKDLELSDRHRKLYWLEAAYYAEGGIPTIKISPDMLHPIVSANLSLCITRARPPSDVNTKQLKQALFYMEENLFSSAPVSWERALWERLGLLPEIQEWIFHYGIFHRHLRVDLARPVARDLVHRPERTNFAADFAARFLTSM